MSYQKIVIYYFSGTGNSRNVASWVAKTASSQNIQTVILNIALIDRANIKPPEENTLIIFVSPIHGFNYPPVMLHFIMRFPRGKSNVVLMNTRAGMLIGKFVTPGLTGCAFWLSALMLIFKGYKVKGLIPVDLPSNWMSLHPSLNERTVKFLHEKNKVRVEKHTNIILSGKADFKAWYEIVQDLLISPIALLYYFVGRFFIAKTFYASSDCNNCNLCIKSCPVKAIIKIDNRPYWTFKCESCMNCMSNCPKRAIETGHGFVLGVILLFVLLMPMVYKGLDIYFVKPESELVQFIIEALVSLGIIAVLYRFLHYAIRIKFLELLVVYTSFTKFRFWGKRYKALK